MKTHKPSKKLKKLPANSPYQKSEKWGYKIYEDFPGDSYGKKLFQCPNCLQWMPRNTIHTCYDARALETAKSDTICPPVQIKTWKVKPNIRSVKPNKDDWIHLWKQWIAAENRAVKREEKNHVRNRK
jgi:hypothetical protein